MSNCKSCQIPVKNLQTGVNCGAPTVNTDGDCTLNADGTLIVTSTRSNTACAPTAPDSDILTPNRNVCTQWQLTDSPEAGLISNIIDESILIGAANMNVYKLLGVYEQGLLQDQTGTGAAFSSGDLPNFPAQNAFDKFVTEWRSLQTGSSVISQSFIGYDFGPILLNNGRNRYGIDTLIKKDVATIKIRQGCNSNNRVTKIRVERSNDNKKWFGVALVDVPDCDGLVTLQFVKTVPSRWWRIRPLAFNGGADDYWSIQALQLIDYEVTNITNIQDRLLLENRDRNYKGESISLKGSYTPIDVVARSSKMGFLQDADQYVITVSFPATVEALGRPFAIGDIIQLPSETQYTPSMQPVLKYLEVQDVAWSVSGYTPTWIPTLQRLIAVPALASQETQDVFGKLTANMDSSGLMDNDDGNASKYQDISNISQTVEANANTQVPERGEDDADITKLSEDLINSAAQHGIDLRNKNRIRTPYGTDALPPNGLPYTEAETFPDNPNNGDYHRITYESLGKNIPPRLYRYSSAKGYWVYLETDLRFRFKNTKPYLQEFVNPHETTAVNPFGKGGSSNDLD